MTRLASLGSDGKEGKRDNPTSFLCPYTANGMSLPNTKHGLDEWSWFPRAEKDGKFVFGKSTEAFEPFRDQLSFLGGLYHPNGPKSDPHVCSDMWLTGAPLQDPKREVYNSVALDQVVAKHTKQFCRQPSLVMSVDAGVGFLSRTGTISYSTTGKPIPAENDPRQIFNRLFRADRASMESQRKMNSDAVSNWSTPSLNRPNHSIKPSANLIETRWTSTSLRSAKLRNVSSLRRSGSTFR